MNSTVQAQKGFRTFLLTLTISLVIFSVLYYLLSTSTKSPDIENNTKSTSYNAEAQSILAADTTASIFENLSKQKLDIPQKSVLAGADEDTSETTQTSASVPATGSTEMTLGLIVSTALLIFGIYVIYLGPRRLALRSFENRVMKDL